MATFRVSRPRAKISSVPVLGAEISGNAHLWARHQAVEKYYSSRLAPAEREAMGLWAMAHTGVRLKLLLGSGIDCPDVSSTQH